MLTRSNSLKILEKDIINRAITGRALTLCGFFILLICFIIPASLDSSTDVYPVIGGGVGALSSVSYKLFCHYNYWIFNE